MKLIDFDYQLPPERIARYPQAVRSQSRLLRLNRATGDIQHGIFSALPDLLNAGDLLVCNDTRVIPARLQGHKQTGGRIEMLVERILDKQRVLAHVKGGKSLKVGSRIVFDQETVFVMQGRCEDLFELSCLEATPVASVIDRLGVIPLPHYMARSAEDGDLERYQTVFSKEKGSVAAPTAGLHFDEGLLQALEDKGIQVTTVTLHIGAGTFSPVRVDDIRAHTMHTESVQVSSAVCEAIGRTRANGGRVIAVGTTAARSLETAALSGQIQAFSGDTSIFIYPGFRFRAVDALITNFHLPRSTLLMLVSAFAGREPVLKAYQEAIEQQYRFYSYGDAMFIA